MRSSDANTRSNTNEIDFTRVQAQLDTLLFKRGSYLSKHGYVLRKEALSLDELVHLKTELRGKPVQDEKYAMFNKDTSYPLYIETVNKIYIPKIYGLIRYGEPDNLLPSYKGKSFDVPLTFSGQLSDVQTQAANALIHQLSNTVTKGGILQLGTGLGKTVCCLNVLTKLNTKTIIVVNKISLLKQWESEIKTFLPGAKIGTIQGQKNVDVHDKDIVVAMLQSLSLIDYPNELFEDFGVAVFDEVHNVCSRVFSKAIGKLSCIYTIGLSATPKRSDSCEYVFKWALGDIVFSSQSKRSGLAPVIQLVKIQDSSYKEFSSINKLTGQKQIMYSTMISDLICMQKRNELIVQMIKSFGDEQRRVLVLSERREHLKRIYGMLKNECVSFTYGMFVGQMKIADLERSKACDIILATYQAFGEGVSEKDLDTLLLLTPKKFIGHLKNTTKTESGKLEQIVGRIFRKNHTDRAPKIVDLCDNFSVYKNQSNGRKAFYKSHFKDFTLEECTVDFDKQEHQPFQLQWAKKMGSQQDGNNTGQSIMTYCMLDD